MYKRNKKEMDCADMILATVMKYMIHGFVCVLILSFMGMSYIVLSS